MLDAIKPKSINKSRLSWGELAQLKTSNGLYAGPCRMSSHEFA